MKKLKVLSVVLVLVMALSFVGDAASTPVKAYQGFAQVPAFRVGPGKDANGVQVYTLTLVMANAMFDENGRIINVFFDSLEVSTPNYDGASMPHFSGWPGTPGYNVSEHKEENAKVIGKSKNTDETIAAEVTGWKTKRERGDNYGMNPTNDWHKQTDYYQNFFKGKTVAELEQWVAKNTSDLNGRPLKTPTDATKPEDKAKYEKLTDAEKAVLADVVSGATMSLKDAHGDFVATLKKAYENRVEITVPIQIAY
ncbi:MAG: FMN-binding protein [Clostridia bacterium BRH_c25]|nr:MAG: FMN-binding protein [Clostridia bacterium BRH_c25]